VKEVVITENDGEWKVELSGEIDAGNADVFFEEVKSAFSIEPKDVHFYCEKLTFIDSTTLGAFVKLSKLIAAEGKKTRLSSLQPKIRKLFSICVLDKLMEIDA
jgi:anti-anti-sigma factor